MLCARRAPETSKANIVNIGHETRINILIREQTGDDAIDQIKVTPRLGTPLKKMPRLRKYRRFKNIREPTVIMSK
jgi:hypothetical protein